MVNKPIGLYVTCPRIGLGVRALKIGDSYYCSLKEKDGCVQGNFCDTGDALREVYEDVHTSKISRRILEKLK